MFLVIIYFDIEYVIYLHTMCLVKLFYNIDQLMHIKTNEKITIPIINYEGIFFPNKSTF